MSKTLRSLALAAVLFSQTVSAAPTQVRAEGTAVVINGNKAAALQQATRGSLVNAIAEALTNLGGSADAADELFDQHGAEILKSSEIASQNVDGNILTVTLNATLDAAALAKFAGLKPGAAKKARAGAPKKVLILASEQLGPKEIIGWSDWSLSVGGNHASVSSKGHLVQLVDELGGLQATLAQAFTSAGYEVVDLRALRGKLAKPQLEVVDLTAAQAQDIAKKGDADLVIIAKGRANSQYHQALAESGMRSGGGNVVAQLIRVADGKVLSSTTQQGAKVHIDQETAQVLALNEAGKLASNELLRSLNP